MTTDPPRGRIRAWLLAAAILFSPDPTKPDQLAVVKAMRSVLFEFPCGAKRTMDQIDTGLGRVPCGLGVGLAVIALPFTSRSQPSSAARPVITALAVITAALLLVSIIYFFIIPTAFFGLAFLLTLISLVREPRAAF